MRSGGEVTSPARTRDDRGKRVTEHSSLRKAHQLRDIALFLFGAVIALVLANAVVAARDLPDYGTWTGIRPLEEKLRKLERFASDEPVDAVILGSSISDFGFSAKVLSDRMTAANGSRYRAFNFSSGATQIVTMPKLYRLLRTVAKPRTLFLVVPAELKRGNVIPPRSPDYIMERAPIHRALAHPWLLPLDKRLWDAPLTRHASALRDLLVFGGYANLAPQGADLYPINEFGDTVSLSYQTSESDLTALRNSHRTTITPLTETQTATLSQQAKLEHYFNELDISAMGQLRRLADSDDCEIVVVTHGVAAVFFPKPIEDSAYVRARRQFFAILAEELNAKLVYKIEEYHAPKFAITDSVHLNRHGAEQFTRLVAADLTGDESQGDPRTRRKHPQVLDMPSRDVTVNVWSALIAAPQAAHNRTLRLRIMRNQSTTPLPPGPLAVMLRMPEERDIVAPARVESDDTVVATFADLPPGTDYLVLARIVSLAGGRAVALSQPLRDYAWSDD